ncbi:type II secretion system protein M [Myxococcota bacterium]|nr:type II secretion system protein M [Myxococcota bacterium]MCZ7618731.1 type II secretion system protein M [Myxococcota bacterium]
MNGLRERWTVWIGGLAPRERLLVGAAGGVLVVLVIWLGLVMPLVGAVRSARLRVETAERELEIATRLQEDLGAIQGRLAAVERRIREGPRGNLFTTLEELAVQSAVKVESMEPQAAASSDAFRETKVQVVLKQVTLAQMVNFLHKIEAAQQMLSVKSLRVRTRSDRKGDAVAELLDVTFTVSSFEPASGA